MGTLAEISAALIGVDAPLDIRDLVKSLEEKNLVNGVIATASLLPVIGALKVFIKQQPGSTALSKLINGVKKIEGQLQINLNLNGEYLTPEGFRVRVEDVPVQKSVGGGGGQVGKLISTIKNGVFSVLGKYINNPYPKKWGLNKGFFEKKLDGTLKLEANGDKIPKIINEHDYYKLADNDPNLFDGQEINQLLKKQGVTLAKVRHGINEVGTLISHKRVLEAKGFSTELIYTYDKSGKMTFTLRPQNSYMPHPALANGQEIKVAGTLEIGSDGKIIVTNKSGHYRPSADGDLIDEKQVSKVNSYLEEVMDAVRGQNVGDLKSLQKAIKDKDIL